jgi:hypothetical protein
MFAYAPVMAGAWQQHQVWDGTYSFKDLLDWYEMTRVKTENEKRYQQWMEASRR